MKLHLKTREDAVKWVKTLMNDPRTGPGEDHIVTNIFLGQIVIQLAELREILHK